MAPWPHTKPLTHVRVQKVVHLEAEVLPAELREDPGQSQSLRAELVLTQPDRLAQIVHYLTAQLVRCKHGHRQSVTVTEVDIGIVHNLTAELVRCEYSNIIYSTNKKNQPHTLLHTLAQI